MTTACRVLLIIGSLAFFNSVQLVDDEVFHFTNPSQGNAVWILDESSLPWTGGYQFLRSISGMPTTLISVVDSSTGVTLGQCVAPQGTVFNNSKQFEQFSWELTSSGLDCNFEHGAAKRVEFDASPNPRTFSIRIQSVTGPACLRNMVVQTEEATGCPPHLSRNSFSANSLNCSCPYLEAEAANEDGENDNEDVDMLASANTPQFPLFKGIDSSVLGNANSASQPQWTLAPSPCANYQCHNNGTCLVSRNGAATCLCRNGFTGEHCELDVCVSVPCQNGGVCRSNNNGIAYCECPPAFTGLLCESTHQETELTCKPECSNGQCVIKDGQASCECRQGFTGANCNVLDVCLGDAACSMFGPDAKCVLDDNMDKMVSASLMNGTYDCLCPHPIHGQFVDCIQLHAPAATSVQPSSPIETFVTPSFPVLEISQLPTGQPAVVSTTTFSPVQTQPTPVQTVQNFETNAPSQPSLPTQPFGGFTVTRDPLRITDVTSTLPPPFNQRIITGGEPTWTQQPSETTQTVSQTMTTFVFPQTPETTSVPTSPITQQHQTTKFVPTIVPTEHEEEEDEDDEEETTDETEETFPTPSTIQIVPSVPTTIGTTSETSTTLFTTPSSTPDSEDDEEEDLTTEEVTENSTQPSTVAATTEETTTEEHFMTSDETEEEMIPSTTLTSLPFWMTTTLNRIAPSVASTSNMPVPQPATSTENAVEEEGSDEEMPTESNEKVVPKNVEVPTTPSDVSHHHTTSGKQSSAAASWIIAIIALIVLGLLLLATSLFILRYIRQSRKLHGKYNPAREEHNLSAAYAMPMSHIAKEERLI